MTLEEDFLVNINYMHISPCRIPKRIKGKQEI